MSSTAKLALPNIADTQALKHITHNEALRALDAIVQVGVADRNLATPPASPADGESYIVAAGATDAWTGKENQIAAWQDNVWSFYPPNEGWLAWVGDEDQLYVWSGTLWVKVSDSDLQNVDMIGINATADTTNRLSVSSTATLFNHAGAGHQVKLNKNLTTDTASFLFQDSFSGRAEIGLTGDDDFHFKVSPDGTAWREAIIMDDTSGHVSFPNTPLENNLLINGSFDIWQRGTSFTGLANGYTADRWVVTGSGTFDISQQNFALGQTAVPGSPKHYIHLQRATSGNYWFLQRIEAPSNYSDQTVTLSFWAKASAAVFVDAYLWCHTAGGSADFAASTTQTLNITTGWQKFTATWDISSFTGKTINDDSGAWLGPNLTLHNLAIAASIDIAQVRLETGSTASGFAKRPVAVELSLCQRYYEKNDGAGSRVVFQNNVTSGSTYPAQVSFKTQKRAAPTITLANAFAAYGFSSTVGSITVDAGGFSEGRSATSTVAAGYYQSNWTADAEL